MFGYDDKLRTKFCFFSPPDSEADLDHIARYLNWHSYTKTDWRTSSMFYQTARNNGLDIQWSIIEHVVESNRNSYLMNYQSFVIFIERRTKWTNYCNLQKLFHWHFLSAYSAPGWISTLTFCALSKNDWIRQSPLYFLRRSLSAICNVISSKPSYFYYCNISKQYRRLERCRPASQ